jgi:hypothetical protein
MPPTPSMRDNSPLPDLNQIHPAPIDSLGLRPSRHGNLQVLPLCPMPVRPLAMLPPTGAKVLAPAQCP